MTVPVGVSQHPALNVALSAIELPVVAVAGCWLVVIEGSKGLIVMYDALPLRTFCEPIWLVEDKPAALQATS